MTENAHSRDATALSHPATITDGHYSATLTDIGAGSVSVHGFADARPIEGPRLVRTAIAEGSAQLMLMGQRALDDARGNGRRDAPQPDAFTLAFLAPWPQARQVAEHLAIVQTEHIETARARSGLDSPPPALDFLRGAAAQRAAELEEHLRWLRDELDIAASAARAELATTGPAHSSAEAVAVERARVAMEAMLGDDTAAAMQARTDVRVHWHQDDLLGRPQFRGVDPASLLIMRAELLSQQAALTEGVVVDQHRTDAVLQDIGEIDYELRRRDTSQQKPTTIAHGRYTATVTPLTGLVGGPAEVKFAQDGRPLGDTINITVPHAATAARDLLDFWQGHDPRADAAHPAVTAVAAVRRPVGSELGRLRPTSASSPPPVPRHVPGSAAQSCAARHRGEASR